MMTKFTLGKIGVFNLIIVAAIGVLMRYKIGFEFPFFDQKNLLHGHSHFAFAGWVSHILYTLLTFSITDAIENRKIIRRLKNLTVINLLLAYGMLISFVIQGYDFVSIALSTLSVFISYFFAWQYISETKKHWNNNPAIRWYHWALVMNSLSSLGTFYLAYMMVTKTIEQELYLGSVYFFLHFQYSGWFFFACMGIFISKLNLIIPEGVSKKDNHLLFLYFSIASILAYFLSILWANLPCYIFILPVIGVILQLYGLVKLISILKTYWQLINSKWTSAIRVMYGLALLALIIKLFLQSGSLHPEISKLAFGFRSIVIAYLHLVLLGVTTIFLLGTLLHESVLNNTRSTFISLGFFCFGVFVNEFILMVQGIASFCYSLIKYLNEAIIGVSVILFLSLCSVFYFSFYSKKK